MAASIMAAAKLSFEQLRGSQHFMTRSQIVNQHANLLFLVLTQEPKKFELQGNERKTTDFWSPPSKEQKQKARKRLPHKVRLISTVKVDWLRV